MKTLAQYSRTAAFEWSWFLRTSVRRRKHGEIALDGEGGNSPFVTALVRHIATPGIEINKLFRLVRDDVLAATGRRQEPFVYGSLPARISILPHRW